MTENKPRPAKQETKDLPSKQVQKQTHAKGKGWKIALVVTVGVIAVAICGTLIANAAWGPKKLDVKATAQAYTDSANKLGITLTEQKAATTNSQTHLAKANLTAEQITSFFHYCLPENFPIQNLAMAMTADNQVQISVQLSRDQVIALLKNSGSLPQNLEGMLGMIPDNFLVSCTLDGNITDNRVAGMKMNGLRVGNALISSIANQVLEGMGKDEIPIDELVNQVLDGISKENGFIIRSAYAKDGGMVIEGEFPDTMRSASSTQQTTK